MDIVLAVAAASTWSMVGLIWFVQIVHYPLLAAVPADAHARIAARHRYLTAFVVGPPMAAEGVTALILLADRPDGVDAMWAWLGAAAMAVALSSTVFVQVPLHGRLADGPDPDASRRLVATNWIRTLAWTVHGVAVAVMVVQAVG